MSSIQIIPFLEYENKLFDIESFVEDGRITYVFAYTRDGCSQCETLKPKLERLAKKMTKKYQGDVRNFTVQFKRIHVPFSKRNKEVSKRAKKEFKHPAYPAVDIYIRTPEGPRHFYRGVNPSVESLKREIEEAVSLAKSYYS